jgi:hypothetical protein
MGLTEMSSFNICLTFELKSAESGDNVQMPCESTNVYSQSVLFDRLEGDMKYKSTLAEVTKKVWFVLSTVSELID